MRSIKYADIAYKFLTEKEYLIFQDCIFDESSVHDSNDPVLRFSDFASYSQGGLNVLFINCNFRIKISINNIESGIKKLVFRKCECFDSISLFNLKFESLFLKEIVGNNSSCYLKVKNCEIESANIHSLKDINLILYEDTIFSKDFVFSDSVKGISMKIVSEFRCGLKILNSEFNYFNISSCILPQDKLVEFSNCNFVKLGLFQNLYFGENVKFKNCDLTRSSFLFSIFNKAFFTSSKFEEDVYKYVDLHLWEISGNNILQLNLKESIIFNEIKDQIEYATHFDDDLSSLVCDPHDIVTTIRMFEANLDARKDVELSGNFHKMGYEYRYLYDKLNFKNKLKKSFSSKGISQINKNSVFKIINEGFRAFLFFLYKKFSLYGESYTRSFIWILVIILLSSCIYFFTGIKYSNVASETTKIQTEIIRYTLSLEPTSIKNFTSFSWYGDYLKCIGYSLLSSTPLKIDATRLTSGSDTTSVISTMQLICQLILITLFIAAIRRKFKRN